MKLKIPYQRFTYKYAYWLCGFCVTLGFLELVIAARRLFNGTSAGFWILNLLLGLLLLGRGLFYFFDRYRNPPTTDLTLADQGISYTIKDTRHHLKWDDIQDVNFAGKDLTVRLKSNHAKKLDTRFLRYKKRQTVKQKLREFTAQKGIQYSSKY